MWTEFRGCALKHIVITHPYVHDRGHNTTAFNPIHTIHKSNKSSVLHITSHYKLRGSN